MDLPDDAKFDAVVLGTGLPNAILAAALSRIGKTVLHLDRYDFYGQEWATFNLKELRSLDQFFNPKAEATQDSGVAVTLGPDEMVVDARHSALRFGFEEAIHAVSPPPPAPAAAPPQTNDDAAAADATIDTKEAAPPAAKKGDGPPEPAPAVELTPEQLEAEALEALLGQYRRYSIDLLPKACLSRGALIDLLISSNIGRYLEFKAVSETFIRMADGNREVPCSKQTLLLNRSVSPKEKRLLMKFLQFCTKADAPAPEDEAAAAAPEVPDTAVLGYLKEEWKFSDDLAKYIMYAIGNVEPQTSAREALGNVRQFFSSIGQYGKTPFIYPMYGTGEVPQAFCRLCAVFGGTYMLRQGIDGFLMSRDGGERCSGIVLNGKPVKAPWVVTTGACVPESLSQGPRGHGVTRAVLITDGSVVPECGDNKPIVTLCIPPDTEGNPKTVNAFVFESSSAACPSGKWVTQLVSQGSGNSARADLEPLVHALTTRPDEAPADDKPKPNLLYAAYFSVDADGTAGGEVGGLDGLAVSRQPRPDALNFIAAVGEAKRLFQQICPGEEFLPTAPNPEDIDWGPEPEEEPAAQVSTEAIETRLSTLEERTRTMWTRVSRMAKRIANVSDRAAALAGGGAVRSDEFRLVLSTLAQHDLATDVEEISRRIAALGTRLDALAPAANESEA
mmetsp:Transcript_36963/g.96835  ORF Transcript_36963/g.96835 Transcript_36963/m.96835 type:complete len:674 (-) Transcript_36963:2727-4748(-)